MGPPSYIPYRTKEGPSCIFVSVGLFIVRL